MSNSPLIIPKQLPNPEGQAKLILASNGLGLIQPVFFKVDENSLAIEQSQQPDIPANWMGLPVFDTVTLASGTFKGDDDKPFAGVSYVNNQGLKIDTKPLQLTNCLHVVNMVKNIIKTPIAGADGTVKEFIGLSDYSITLSGMLVSQYANTPPQEEIRQLYELCKAPIPIPVASNFLTYFEIFTIVIDGEPTFTQIEGTRNAIMFTINCVSDKPFEVEFNQNNKGKTSPVSVPSFR